MLDSRDRDEDRDDEAEMRLLDDKGFFMLTINGEESFKSVCLVVSDIGRWFIKYDTVTEELIEETSR